VEFGKKKRELVDIQSFEGRSGGAPIEVEHPLQISCIAELGRIAVCRVGIV
jgi:hypothetical protein